MNNSPTTDGTRSVRAILLKLAKHQEELAAPEAAPVPYWAPCPPAVIGRRAAAEALRAQGRRAVHQLVTVAS